MAFVSVKQQRPALWWMLSPSTLFQRLNFSAGNPLLSRQGLPVALAAARLGAAGAQQLT